MKDALLVIDVFNDFDHEDGEALQASFRQRVAAMVDAIAAARDAEIPIIYVNDQRGRWDSDAPGLVRETLAKEEGGILAPLAPDAAISSSSSRGIRRSTTRPSCFCCSSFRSSGSSSSARRPKGASSRQESMRVSWSSR